MTKYKQMINGFLKYKYLLFQLVNRDIKVRYRRSFLGILWTLLNPLLMMIVLTLVFSNLFKSNIDNYPVYFLSGSIIFTFNSDATTQAMTSIIGNSGLIKKIYIPKYLFPISKVFSCLVNFFFSFIAMIIVMLVTCSPFHLTMFLSIIPLFYLFLFTSGLSLFLSACTVFFRDLVHLYGVLIMAWTYFTPIFYPITIMPEKLRWLFALNPMHHYIEYFRALVLYGYIPGTKTNIECFLIGLISMVLGLYVFYKKQDKFILYV